MVLGNKCIKGSLVWKSMGKPLCGVVKKTFETLNSSEISSLIFITPTCSMVAEQKDILNIFF